MGLDKYFKTLIVSADDCDGFKIGMDAGDLSAEQIEQCLSMARTTQDAFYNKVKIYEI